jgi:hypothetical protein
MRSARGKIAMSSFSKPVGINFRSPDEVPAPDLARILCRVASFLQSVDPYVKLQRYLDCWEHDSDGYHAFKEEIDFHGLFQIVESPKALLWHMTDDDNVFIGIAPNDHSWYLRFYLCWDEEGFNLKGRFDITLPARLVQRFRKEMAEVDAIRLQDEDAETYYKSICG